MSHSARYRLAGLLSLRHHRERHFSCNFKRFAVGAVGKLTETYDRHLQPRSRSFAVQAALICPLWSCKASCRGRELQDFCASLLRMFWPDKVCSRCRALRMDTGCYFKSSELGVDVICAALFPDGGLKGVCIPSHGRVNLRKNALHSNKMRQTSLTFTELINSINHL